MVYQNFGVSSYAGYYEDETESNISRWAHIPSDQVDGQSIRLFVVHNSGVEDSIRVSCESMGLDSVKQGNREVDMACLSKFYRVVIDADTLPDLRWWYRNDVQSNQVGLITWLDLSAYSAGSHEIHVLHRLKSSLLEVARIPFFKESTPLIESNSHRQDSIRPQREAVLLD